MKKGKGGGTRKNSLCWWCSWWQRWGEETAKTAKDGQPDSTVFTRGEAGGKKRWGVVHKGTTLGGGKNQTKPWEKEKGGEILLKSGGKKGRKDWRKTGRE